MRVMVNGHRREFGLTKKELEIAKLLARGMMAEEICKIENIKRDTYKVHLINIYGKIGMHDRLNLMLVLRMILGIED